MISLARVQSRLSYPLFSCPYNGSRQRAQPTPECIVFVRRSRRGGPNMDCGNHSPWRLVRRSSQRAMHAAGVGSTELSRARSAAGSCRCRSSNASAIMAAKRTMHACCNLPTIWLWCRNPRPPAETPPWSRLTTAQVCTVPHDHQWHLPRSLIVTCTATAHHLDHPWQCPPAPQQHVIARGSG